MTINSSIQSVPTNIKSASPLLSVDGLTWTVAGKKILSSISFSLEAGAFVGVIGPNGAGKSSLLRSLFGAIKPSSGCIQFKQKNLTDYPARALAKKIAVVLQEPPPRFEVTLLDVVRMGLIPHKSLLSFDTREDKQAIIEALDKVDLKDKLEQNFNSLSGGEKQRAMIARAILQKPELLIMDEPTNHLDVHHQLEVLQLAKSMQTTSLVSIHDLNLAAAFCDQLILLNQGQLVAMGKAGDILTQNNLSQVFAVNASVDQNPFTRKPRITFDPNHKPCVDQTQTEVSGLKHA